MGANSIIEQIKQAVVEGKHTDIEVMVRAAIDEGIEGKRIIDEALISAMDIVGKQFSDGRFYVPEMLVAALAMKKGLALIQPLLKGEHMESKGRILIGTVKGDNHDIGKNLVSMMLEGAGFEVVDLGVDISAEKIARKVTELKPQILGLSTLLTTTMPEMPKVIKTLEEKGLRKRVKVMVGGAPVDARFAKLIGADGYAGDAAEAVPLARTLTSQQ
jgi:5-methyltetrahydrofolate--homocysteine methyltransferase